MTNKKQVRPTSGGQTVWLTYPSQHSMPQAISYRLIFCQKLFSFFTFDVETRWYYLNYFREFLFSLPTVLLQLLARIPTLALLAAYWCKHHFFANKNFHVFTGHHFYFVYHEYPEIQKLKHRWAYVIIPLLFSLR